MAEHKTLAEDTDSDDIRILPPDYTLKKIIGEDVDIREIFGGENVEKAQKVIDQHKDKFLDWVRGDIAALEQHYKAAMAHLADCDSDIRKLARTAFVIKSQAGTFGFDLATQVAKSLDDFCTLHFRSKPDHMTVVRKHIDTLNVIFDKNITGDGGVIGSELAQSLRKLVQKFKH